MAKADSQVKRDRKMLVTTAGKLSAVAAGAQEKYIFVDTADVQENIEEKYVWPKAEAQAKRVRKILTTTAEKLSAAAVGAQEKIYARNPRGICPWSRRTAVKNIRSHSRRAKRKRHRA